MYHLASKDVISLDINGHTITIIPTQKLISCNIEEAYGLDYSTSEGLVGWTPRWINGKETPFYDYSSIKWLCKLRNKPIPKVLQPYLYPLTKHDDLQENTIMTTNQLINIQQQTIGNDTVNAVSARELHKFLESKRQFTDWVKPYISEDNDYGFVETVDFIAVHVGVNRVNQQVMIDYWFTIDMAKEVSMLSKTEKGKQARKYFIECERKANNPQIEHKPVPRKSIGNASLVRLALKEVHAMKLSEESKQVVIAHLLHDHAGLPLNLMLPEIKSGLSPEQIAQKLGTNSNVVGRIISTLGIRGNDEYCTTILNKATHSDKQVPQHLYNNTAVEMITKRFKERTNK